MFDNYFNINSLINLSKDPRNIHDNFLRESNELDKDLSFVSDTLDTLSGILTTEYAGVEERGEKLIAEFRAELKALRTDEFVDDVNDLVKNITLGGNANDLKARINALLDKWQEDKADETDMGDPTTHVICLQPSTHEIESRIGYSQNFRTRLRDITDLNDYRGGRGNNVVSGDFFSKVDAKLNTIQGIVDSISNDINALAERWCAEYLKELQIIFKDLSSYIGFTVTVMSGSLIISDDKTNFNLLADEGHDSYKLIKIFHEVFRGVWTIDRVWHANVYKCSRDSSKEQE